MLFKFNKKHSAAYKRKKKVSLREKRRYMWAYIFLLPQALVFLGLSLYPIIMSYVYSLYRWEGIGPLENFVGLGNYFRLFQDPRFWSAFGNTIVYTLGTTILGVGISLILAIILNDSQMKGKAVYRTVYFIPVVTTTAIIGIIMQNIFGINGLVNEVLQVLRITDQPVQWMTDPTLAMAVLIVVGTWKSLGITMIYWLSGLQGIPSELYEAAQIDGAGFWKTLFYVTLPLLKPVLAVIVLLSIVSGMNVFDLVKTLTNGGPYFATETLDLYIYNYAFTGAHTDGVTMMGYASAAGVALGLSTFLVSLLFGGIGFTAAGGMRRKRSRKEVANNDS